MSHLFDTPLTLDSPTEKWHEAMEASVRLAKLVERGRFLPEKYSIRDETSGEVAAGRITSFEAGSERAEWRRAPRSPDMRREILQSLEGEGGDLSNLLAVSYLKTAFSDIIIEELNSGVDDPFLKTASAEWSTFSPTQKNAAILSAWDHRETQRLRSFTLGHQHLPSLTARQSRRSSVSQEDLRKQWA